MSYRRPGKSDLSTLAAKFEAQKLAFAPISFQATKALRDLGILQKIAESDKEGITSAEIVNKIGISDYGVETLLEVGENLKLVKFEQNKYYIRKLGLLILNDEMTKVNMNFVNDVCYEGSFFMQESIKESKPVGLKVFGKWETIYQALSELPKDVQKSWFDFDHFYSDRAFDDALKIVFKNKPKKLFDIGGNTGKWAVKCLNYDSDVEVTILDLPGQLEMARKNLESLSLIDRANLHEINVLNNDGNFPKSADVVWMSQFLDCFSKEEITNILSLIAKNIDENCEVFILEPFWDQQKYEAAKFSLNHTSLYFTCMANGNSKIYSLGEMADCANLAGLKLDSAFHDIGENDYSLLKFSKK